MTWTALYDDYGAGTMFITADPSGEQQSFAEGLEPSIALRVIEAHNRAVNAYEPLVKALHDMDAAWQWVVENHRNVMVEMPTEYFRVFETARVALATVESSPERDR